MPGVLEKNKITAQNLIDLKNAINQIGSYNLLKKETSVVKDTTVKYYCDLTGVLSAYDVINVIFPNETENLSSYPQISIDNKNTYYEIKKGNSLVALKDLQGKANVLYFDGTNWQVVSNDSTGDSLPIGTTLLWYDDNIPNGYVELNGQELSRATYSELFDVIGTTFGSGDGSTTFNVPDMRDKVPIGVSSTDTNINVVGKIYGEKTHKLTIQELASHSHGFQGGSALFAQKDQGVKGLGPGSYWTEGVGSIPNTSNAGGDQPHNNMQPSFALRFICKAFNVTSVTDNIAEVVQDLSSDSVTNVPSVAAINDAFATFGIKCDQLYTGGSIALTSSNQTVTLLGNVEDYNFLFIVLRNNNNFHACWVIPKYYYNNNINMSHAVFNQDGNYDVATLEPLSVHNNQFKIKQTHMYNTYSVLRFVTCYGLK